MTHAELRALLRVTGCAVEHGDFVFLCDPRWSVGEQAQVRALQSDLATGRPATSTGWVCVPTGGTSGRIRFARHDERTLGAAVRGFLAHFGLSRVNAVDVLPPLHVSGLMSRLRCAATGGTHVPWDWKKLEAGERPVLSRGHGDWVVSLVPTQLQRLLASAEATEWLRQFAIVFLGGGPAWPALTDAAAGAGLRVSLSYGMTETAAMVAALKPEEFLAGGRSCGAPMPHARITLTRDGTIRIEGESVFRGYAPQLGDSRVFATADLGEFDERGWLRVLGRRDEAIITGGEKVNPTEVEAVLRATGEFIDVAVLGVPDAEWGQSVVACYPAIKPEPDLTLVRQRVAEQLPGFKRPKRFVAIADWPRNAQGKLNRAELAAGVREA